MTTRKHIRLSALSFVLVLCGSLLVSLWQPFLPGLTDTVHAELSPADVAECYAKLNGKTTGEVGVDLKSLYDAKCSKDARGGTCTISEKTTYGQFGTSITIQYYSCTESQATDKIPAIKEALRGVYANAVSKKLCDGLPRDEKTNCSNSVKTATVACLNTFFDNGYEKSNITFPNIDEGTIATCVAGKTGRKADDIKQALLGAKSDADAETKKVNDDAEAARKQACEASGKYWQPGEIGGTGSCSDKAPPACQGGSLGWLICPLTEMFSSIISAIAKYLDGLLFFKPLIIGDTASGDAIYSLWRVVIVPANLLLVVAFLVVIFSQATSFGLSSYGIKKMLPRIIAAAILINLSYFLCAVAVDITNVIGAGVKGMMENVPLPNGTSLRGSTWVDWFVTGVVAHLTAGVAIVTGSVYYIVPMLAAAVIAVLTAFLVVAARQVLITLMIIIAPLAFAALVLPNTNELFTKWRKAFAALLFMYPLIMFVFYGSMVVSKIVALTTPQANDPAVNLIQQILVLCILIFPLFSLPIIMKAAGGLLQRFGLWANDKSKGLIDRSNMWAKKKKARTTYQQMKELSNNAKDLSAQRTAISRFSNSKGAWGFIARRGAYGLGRKNSILPSTNRANVLLGSQAMKAKSGIDKDEREMIGAHINRRAAELLSEGRVSSDGKTFTNSHGQTQGIDTLDQKTQDALKYARDNNVLSTTNGSKAISEVLYAQGGMNSARLEGLTSGVTKEDRADFIDHSNQHAAQAGMKHMMFNSVDNAGNIHVGGTLGEGKQTHEGVANKLVEGGLSNISKESFDDADPRKDAALAAALHTFRRDNAEAFEKELAKMRPEQVKKMGDMFARQLAAGNGSVMENAQMTGVSLDVTYNAAIAKYKP